MGSEMCIRDRADLVFPFIVNSYGTFILFVYLLIAISQLRIRARLEREHPARIKVRMWLFPYLTYFAIIAMLVILAAMGFSPDPEQRLSLWFGLGSLALLVVLYLLKQSFGNNTKPPFPASGKIAY